MPSFARSGTVWWMLVGIAALGMHGTALALDGSKIAPYGLACKAALGALPLTWNCQSGTLLSVDGVGTCSMPPWLGLDSVQCVEGSRLLALATSNPATDVRVICRRYKVRTDAATNKTYEDVAVVAHNRKTGDTCYFQALDKSNGMDGTDVPSPMADAAVPAESAVAARAASFWLVPNVLGGGIACTKCHDNDAWMHTPYIDQLALTDANRVPEKDWDTWKLDAINEANNYALVEQAFFAGIGWPMPRAVLTAKVRDDNDKLESQLCTSCHRIADRNTKSKWLDWATQNPSNIPSEKTGLNWDVYRWMGQTVEPDEAAWHRTYDKHIAAMKCCLNHPNFSGCASMPVLGIKKGDKPAWGSATNGTCIDDTGDVAFHFGIGSNVVAGRAATDDSCDATLDKQARGTFQITHAKIGGGSDTITKDATNKTLGQRIPTDANHNPDAPLFPGDVLIATLHTTSAWDAQHHLLQFDRWSDAETGGPGTPNRCPCEDATQAACRFRTRGASDWFGKNPGSPTYPGDPPALRCIAQFKTVGDCRRPEHGSVPDNLRRIGGRIDCDCEHVSAGLLTGPFIKDCQKSELQLKQLAAEDRFKVTVGADGTIASGNVCDSVVAGPSAWPLQGGPATPPAKADGPTCRYVGGLIQYDCD